MRHQKPKITINKLDAARRQLRAAIRLWFTNGDPVAVHTLASAAHEIIHTLFRRAGFRGLMFDAPYIKDEFRSQWAKLLKRHASFFKHAREDPDGVTVFDPATNFGLLAASAYGLRKLGEPLAVEDACFTFWLRVHRPTWFANQVMENGIPVNLFQRYGDIEIDDFFEMFESLWRQGKAPGQQARSDVWGPTGPGAARAT
jgi:hypothetical protein